MNRRRRRRQTGVVPRSIRHRFDVEDERESSRILIEREERLLGRRNWPSLRRKKDGNHNIVKILWSFSLVTPVLVRHSVVPQ